MNREIRTILESENIIAKRITLKGNVKIIDDGERKYVIKKKRNNLSEIYKYLSSRAFDYYPKKLLESDNYDIYEYVEEVNEPFEQKILDMIHLVSVLHNKTTFYKNIDSDEYKYLYESILNKIEYLNNYYNDLVSVFEKDEYMAPSAYLLLRNISKVFESLNFCNYYIEKWYEIVNEKKRVRVVHLHNNLSIDHYIKSRTSYLISWDKSKRDMPIYDLLHLFDLYYYEVDFCDLLHSYEMNYPLLEEERILLFVMISLPEKIILGDSEYSKCLRVKKFYDKLKASEIVVSDYIPKEKIS